MRLFLGLFVLASIFLFVLEQATGFPGANRDDYAAAELVDSDTAGFLEQVLKFVFPVN